MEKIIDNLDNKYIVTSSGDIISLKGKRKILKGKIGRHGYREVLINHKGKRMYLLVHLIVAKYYIINPKNKRTINHIDSNKLNNNVNNLEWATDSENLIHARDNGKLSTCKINMQIAEKIRKDKGTHRELAIKYGIGKTQIGLIKQNKRWVI